jgi:hypothetical protein
MLKKIASFHAMTLRGVRHCERSEAISALVIGNSND